MRLTWVYTIARTIKRAFTRPSNDFKGTVYYHVQQTTANVTTTVSKTLVGDPQTKECRVYIGFILVECCAKSQRFI